MYWSSWSVRVIPSGKRCGWINQVVGIYTYKVGPPFTIAFSWCKLPNFSMVYGTYNYSIHGFIHHRSITGGPHIVEANKLGLIQPRLSWVDANWSPTYPGCISQKYQQQSWICFRSPPQTFINPSRFTMSGGLTNGTMTTTNPWSWWPAVLSSGREKKRYLYK